MPPPRRPVLLGLVAGLVIGAGALAALFLFGRLTWPFSGGEAAELRAARRNAIVRAVERTRLSVVTIRVEGRRRVDSARDELLFFPFAPGRITTARWIGSGFFIDADGYILTNEHVVRGARSIAVSLVDASQGVSLQAQLVGASPEFDLALLHVSPAGMGPQGLGSPPSHFVPVRFGDSENLMVGEWAIAIGSPFGDELGSLDPSVSVGVVSAVQRDLPAEDPELGPGPYREMIQTDASIHPGNSGGPLVDATGAVIGVNTVNFTSPREGGTDLHFAIPIHIARRVAAELRDYGEVRRPWIGWSVAELSPEVRGRLQVPEEEGILTVTSVVPDSPAARAGIRSGDLLYRIQGLDPYSRARAERILYGTPVGADVEVHLVGVDGQLRKTMVHVIEDPLTRAVRESRPRRPTG